MGNVITSVASSVVWVGNTIYSGCDKLFDYLTYHICSEKPTLHLAIRHLEIPVQERDALEAILQTLYKIPGLLITPAKILNDKKFNVYGAETGFVFASGQQEKKSKVTCFCEKAIIYIAKHVNKITEPASSRILHNVTIDDKNYDVPTNLWYTLEINDSKKLYFYIHLSVTKGYKGILFATVKEDNDLLDTIKTDVNEYYTDTLGRNSGSDSDSDETIGDIMKDDKAKVVVLDNDILDDEK